MQIVIDIDENVFTRLFDNGIEDYAIANDDLFAIAKSIRKGTPLPKGHGRLIDADTLGKELYRYTEAPYLYALNQFENAPTIVEVDKAESEDIGNPAI